MSGFSAAYAGARERFSELLLAASPQQLAAIVPACPDWSLKDLLAHVAGVARDMATGNLAGVGDDEWTAAQIAAGADLGVEELVESWTKDSVQVEGALDLIHPAAAGLTVADLVTHEHDARGTLGRPGARDLEAVNLSIYAHVRWLGRRLKENGLGAVEVVAGDDAWTVGPDEPPAATLSGTHFELLRALTGRRTPEEILSLGWTGDPSTYLPVISAYGSPAESLRE